MQLSGGQQHGNTAEDHAVDERHDGQREPRPTEGRLPRARNVHVRRRTTTAARAACICQSVVSLERTVTGGIAGAVTTMMGTLKGAKAVST